MAARKPAPYTIRRVAGSKPPAPRDPSKSGVVKPTTPASKTSYGKKLSKRNPETSGIMKPKTGGPKLGVMPRGSVSKSKTVVKRTGGRGR